MPNNYTPRRAAPDGSRSSSHTSRSVPTRSRTESYRSPTPVDRFPRESRSVSDYDRNSYVRRRPSQSRRRR